MKTYFIIPIFLFGMAGLHQDLSGQNKDAWFDDLVQLYVDGDYWPALLGFERFIETYPNSELAPRALFNRACLLREVGKPDEAISAFRKIMQADFDEYEAYGGIMEQFTLYKNRSAKHLAELYLEAGNFEEAGFYIHLFDKEYPYRHFCGNELTADAIYTASMYARYYEGLGEKEKALHELMPYAFGNGLAENQSILELLKAYLPKTHDRKAIQEELARAKLTFKEKSDLDGIIKLFGVKVRITEYAFYDGWNPLQEDMENVPWAEKLEILFRKHPVFGSYVNL